jgi:hypothetical protein
MLPLALKPVDEIRAFVHDWMKLLASGHLNQACALIDEPNSYGQTWTPERIMKVVDETFGPGTLFRKTHPEGPRFTDPDELPSQREYEVGRLNGDRGFWYDYDLVLNNQRSDLTAQFEFLARPPGYAVVLQDLHVR